MKEFIYDLAFGIFFIIVLFLVFLGFLYGCFYFVFLLNSGTYEYVDLDNKKGTAVYCEPNDSLQLCQKKDGTIVSVKKYKRLK